MERSAIQGDLFAARPPVITGGQIAAGRAASTPLPDFAALNPGYATRRTSSRSEFVAERAARRAFHDGLLAREAHFAAARCGDVEIGLADQQGAELGLAERAEEFGEPAMRNVEFERFLVVAAHLYRNVLLGGLAHGGMHLPLYLPLPSSDTFFSSPFFAVLRHFSSSLLHPPLAQSRAKGDIEGDIRRLAEQDMARHLLSARRVTALLSAGRPRRHGDGGCLYLQINGPDRGAWVFMVKRGGKQRPIGLGSVRDVPLKDARELADACRQAVRKGRDPRTVVAEASGEMTFDTAARELIESMAPSWRNAKHRAQWSMTLLGEMPDKDGNRKKTRYDYCAAIRNKPVSKLTTEDALRVLKPLWQTRPETANRLRGRCERVWDFAKARAHCSGENPFRWRGHLEQAIAKG